MNYRDAQARSSCKFSFQRYLDCHFGNLLGAFFTDEMQVFTQIEHHENIVVGSPEWIAGSRYILSNTTRQMLADRTFGVADEVFNRGVYEAIVAVNPLFADTRRHRRMIYDLMCDFVTITKPRPEYRTWPTSMTEWFGELLVTHSRKSSALHHAMHLQFPDMSCKDLRTCCRDSLRILFSRQLANNGLSHSVNL